jgi:hypothetical protein
MGRTIPSFRMIMDQEIDRVLRTYGKKLPSKRERGELGEVLELSKRHSHACSEAVRLIPMHAILLAIVLEQEKMINQMDKDISRLCNKLGIAIEEDDDRKEKDAEKLSEQKDRKEYLYHPTEHMLPIPADDSQRDIVLPSNKNNNGAREEDGNEGEQPRETDPLLQKENTGREVRLRGRENALSGGQECSTDHENGRNQQEALGA